jgi:site-specific recombinase XerD
MPTGAWREQRDGAILATLLGCGPTVSELLALSVDDLQLDDYAPAVQIASAGLTHGHTAPIAEVARPLLAAWHARRLREPLDGDLLFPAAQSGRPLSAVSVYQLVRDALDAIGFAGRHRGPQTLRNTFARRQLFHGVDAQQLQGWLGLETSRTLDKLRRTLPGTWDSGVS